MTFSNDELIMKGGLIGVHVLLVIMVSNNND
jgi:hypothetical protein